MKLAPGLLLFLAAAAASDGHIYDQGTSLWTMSSFGSVTGERSLVRVDRISSGTHVPGAGAPNCWAFGEMATLAIPWTSEGVWQSTEPSAAAPGAYLQTTGLSQTLARASILQERSSRPRLPWLRKLFLHQML